MTDLATFGLDPVAEAISNHGVIAGQSGAGAWVWSGTFQKPDPARLRVHPRQRHRDQRQRQNRRQRLQLHGPRTRVPADPRLEHRVF
jgi:hypothetical protein